MLLSILSSEGGIGEKILYVLISLIALLPALTLHEWAHGYAAYKLGDSTAKADGRLSINPFDHIDPIGSLLLLLVGFGWAKPVPVNTRHFKKPRRDFAIVSLAGPITNFVLGFISALLYVLAFYICADNGLFGSTTANVILTVFQYSMILNIGLGTFNLIPLPPLDGSNVLICALPNHLAAKYSKLRYYTRYILIGIIVLSYLPYPLSLIYDYLFMPLYWARDGLESLFITIADTIISLFF